LWSYTPSDCSDVENYRQQKNESQKERQRVETEKFYDHAGK